MKVADLEQYFRDLVKLLHAADGKKTAIELSKVVEGLQPFRDHDLVQFANFLARAEGYSRTGIVPVVESKSASRPKARAKPKADFSVLQAEVVSLQNTASSPGVTIELIDELVSKLGVATKGDLLPIADAIGLVGLKNKKKPEIINAIVSRIRSIKQSAMRTSIIDRSGMSN